MSDSPKNHVPIEQRRQIFKEELEILREKRIIPKTDYIRISNAYDRHVQQVMKLEEKARLVRENEDKVQVLEKTMLVNEPQSKEEQKVSIKVHPEVKSQNEKISSENKKKIVVKVEKTSEQLRERNISIVLITGVILLLFGGLIWATSTWGNLNAVLKVVCIGLVSAFFAGNAWIASKLKIKQTAFAFLTLASLFLPITILSASYYQIFGEYLSLQGEGRGLLGFIGGLLCLAIYYKIADNFQSKLFIFISLVTLTVTAIFGMAYLTFTNEVLFLLMAIFNLLFLLNLEKIKNVKKLLLFKPYGLQFITFKIIVEAFVMLTLFLSNIIYSTTLLITSILFFILAYRYKKLYFHFVFSILFTYGYIHLVFNSFLDKIEVVAMALLPLIYTGLFKYLKKVNHELSKSFMLTSVVASSVVFLYVYAMFFSVQETQLFLALLILSAKYVYLSLEEKRKVFTYPAYVLFSLSFIHLGFAFHLTTDAILNLIFIAQICLYIGLYVYNQHKIWSLFRESTLAISGSVLLGITLLRYAEQQWLELSLCFAVISGLFLLTYYKDRSKQLVKYCIYGFPISLTLALITLYLYFNEISPFYEKNGDLSAHLISVALLVIGLGFVIKAKEINFFHVFFITGQVVSLLSFISLMFSSLSPIVITVITLIATGINGLSVKLYHNHLLWLPVLLTSIGAYGSLFAIFEFNSHALNTAFYLFGPLLFLVIGKLIGKFSLNGERYFFWYSQIMNVGSIPIGFALILFGDLSAWLYLFVVVIYVISALQSQIQWQKLVFTYVGFTALYLQVLLFFVNIEFIQYTSSFTLMLTAGIILLLWAVANKLWKNIIEFYLIPFLLVAAGVHLIEVFDSGFPERMELVWIGGETVLLACTWYLLMRRKWEQVVVVPLMFTLIYSTMYSYTLTLLSGISVLVIWMMIMLLVSKWLFKGVIKRTKSGVILDYYRIFGFFYLLVMNGRVLANEVAEPVFEIIVSCLVVVYFIVIRSWTISQGERKLYLAAAIPLTLYPYQVILHQFRISDIWIVEFNILPLLLVGTILLRKIINRGKQTQLIEIIYVSFLFGILIIDALEGNTLNDALIIGVISLVAITFGFIMKFKSYFLAGTGTILLNVYMNTKSLWGQMPWWFYLIIGGIVLIAAASFLEWKKQKQNATSKEILDKNKQRLKNWFNKWN